MDSNREAAPGRARPRRSDMLQRRRWIALVAMAVVAVVAVAMGYLLRAATAPAHPPRDPPSAGRHIPARAPTPSLPHTDGVAVSFVGWARHSGRAPHWADQVGLYLGGKRLKTLSRPQAADPENWRICAPYAGVSCPFSTLRTLARYDGPVRVLSEPPPTCRETIHPLTPDALGQPGADLVVVAPAGTGLDCHGTFDVEVWSVDGAVFAVNLSIGGF